MLPAPAPTAVTLPELDTVATCALSVDHCTTRPIRTEPLESRTVALSCTLLPTTTVADGGETVTVLTTTTSTVDASSAHAKSVETIARPIVNRVEVMWSPV